MKNWKAIVALVFVVTLVAAQQPVNVANIPHVIVDTAPSTAVTNAGTFAVQAAQSGTWTVQPGNTANTTAWKVDGSAVTQPVSNAGTFAVQAAQSGNWTSRIVGNLGVVLDAVIGAAAPGNVVQEGLKDTAGNSQAALSDTNGRQFIKPYVDTTTTSYHASASFAASSTTDNAVLPGNATNTVLVTKITVTCKQTTAGQINVELLKRSVADTVGTAANMTVVPDDANYASGVSVPKSYTGTGPTVGAAVGDLDNAQIGCMASATATPNDVFVFRPLKPIVLRGTAQMLAVNVGNAALTGGNLTVTFDWMETTTP